MLWPTFLSRMLPPLVLGPALLLAVPATDLHAQPQILPRLRAPGLDDAEPHPRVVEPDPSPKDHSTLRPRVLEPEVVPRSRPHTTFRASADEANLQIEVSEALINRLLSGRRTETEPVRDCILGANILGQQTIGASVGIDLHPRAEGIHATMRLDGECQMNTIGQTPQARVTSVGRHQIRADKDIFHDGRIFTTVPARVQARVATTNIAASTPFDGVPLLQGIARQMAVGMANGRRRLSEPIVWRRVSSSAFEKFNREIDVQLAEANQTLEREVRPRLREWSLLPARESVRSTETLVIYTALLRTGEGQTGAVPPRRAVPETALTLKIHESLLDQAADALQLEGQSRKVSEIVPIVNRVVSLLGGRALRPDESPPEARTDPSSVLTVQGLFEPEMIFSETRPIRFHFEDEAFAITLQARFELAGRTVVPEQRIRIRFRGELTEREFKLKREDVTVGPIDPMASELQSMYARMVQPRVEENIADVVFPRTRTIPQPFSRNIRVQRLEAKDGWLTAELDVE